MIKSPTPLSIIMPIRSNTLLPQQRVSGESLFAFSFFNNSEKEKKHVSKKTPPTAAVEQQSMVENEVRSHSGHSEVDFRIASVHSTVHTQLSLSSYTQKLPNDFLKLSLNVPYQPLFQKESKQTNKQKRKVTVLTNEIVWPNLIPFMPNHARCFTILRTFCGSRKRS